MMIEIISAKNKLLSLIMNSTKTIKLFDSIYGIIFLFMLIAIASFSLAFAFEIIFPIYI